MPVLQNDGMIFVHEHGMVSCDDQPGLGHEMHAFVVVGIVDVFLVPDALDFAVPVQVRFDDIAAGQVLDGHVLFRKVSPR